ncbi:MAG TPA: hypothetical protein VMQ93_13815 [Novosphingobium sp.]|nr:hypothetical protein [Novosphingobium sp.]
MSVLLIIGIPYYWYLVDSGVGPRTGEANAESAAMPLTMAQLRALAAVSDGPRPVALRVETVGHRLISRNMLVAGEGLRPSPTAVRAYEVVMSSGGPVVIDAGASAQAASEHDFDHFDRQAQARVDRARARAAEAILLADRPVHNGGHPSGARRTGRALPPPGKAPYAAAPGVVVIPATGLSTGSAMVYLRLANSREYLFTGDVAKLDANWRQMRLPARFATRGEPDAYRRENRAWLTTINALHHAAPQMIVVSGHEPGKVPFSAGTFSD